MSTVICTKCGAMFIEHCHCFKEFALHTALEALDKLSKEDFNSMYEKGGVGVPMTEYLDFVKKSQVSIALEEMGLIKHLHDSRYRGGDCDVAFNSAEIEVLSYMRTLGKVEQAYTHRYGSKFWCEDANIEVNMSVDEDCRLVYSVGRYGQ